MMRAAGPARVLFPEQEPEDDDVRRPDRESSEQKLSAAELCGARGHEAGDEKGERDEVSEHKEAEKGESGAARSHEAGSAERQKEVDREQKRGSREQEPDPPRQANEFPLLRPADQRERDEGDERGKRRGRGLTTAFPRFGVGHRHVCAIRGAASPLLSVADGLVDLGAEELRNTADTNDLREIDGSPGYRCATVVSRTAAGSVRPDDGARTGGSSQEAPRRSFPKSAT
jgi:hypothetical protein